MKKLQEMIRPFLAIILGALLFLVYLNYLQLQGAALALGIIAVIFSALYVGMGILTFVLGARLFGAAKKALDVTAIALFPVLMFVQFLMIVINNHEMFGPTSWVILIIMLFASICAALVYALAAFAPSKTLKRIAALFASFFVLALLLDILFNVYTGFPVALGDVSLVEFATYFVYVSMLLNALGGLEEGAAPVQQEAPAQVEEKQEEAQPEEPKEE